MRCDIVSPEGQTDFQGEWWKQISEGAVQHA